MSEPGPFDRILESSAARDKTARTVLIGMGVLGLLLLVLVLPPISLLDSGGGGIPKAAPASSSSSTVAKLPKVPQGYEALSALIKPNASKDQGPADMTVSLAQQVTDGRNLGLYTYKDGQWQRIAAATLVNNGNAAKGQVSTIPANIAVLRRVSSAVEVSGWLVSGAQPDPAAIDVLTVVNPVDYYPAADGTVQGTASQLGVSGKNVLPTVRATAQQEVDAVNTILANPQLRDAHVNALVQIALLAGNNGVDLDYGGVQAARKPDFTAFIASLADKLHASNKQLTLTLPTPTKTGINWDTGAYDWKEIGKYADEIKLAPELDPSLYYKKMEEVVAYLKPNVDLKKVELVIGRSSKEKASNGIRPLSLRDGLALASNLEVRTNTAITPNSSVLIVGKNIFQDDGASGVRWDDAAFAVSFSFPGVGGQHTVWFENSLSIAFKIDFARRFGLGGVHIDDISLDPSQASLWEPLTTYVGDGTVKLSQPNGPLLRPLWQTQAGTIEPNLKGNVVWKAPAQAGVYDVSLVVSDGVVRATQKVVLDVRPAQASTPVPSGHRDTAGRRDGHVHTHALVPIRVIAGEAGGRVLKGLSRAGTRPTSDRVREALFAILESHGADLTNVLDLYSGTGAMGIEALSRGAGRCDFVEMDARACDVIKENLRLTGYADRSTVNCTAVARAGGRLHGPYTLLVADPPYEYDRAESEIGALVERGLLGPVAIIAVEHSKHKEWPEALGGRQRLLTRRHGDSALTLYR